MNSFCIGGALYILDFRQEKRRKRYVVHHKGRYSEKKAKVYGTNWNTINESMANSNVNGKKILFDAALRFKLTHLPS